MDRLAGNTARVGVGLLCVAQFVVVLDVTIVATALPAIGADLCFPGTQVTWVATTYTIVQGSTLLVGGRIADLAGSRRIFRAGLIVFVLASALCAAAWNPAALLFSRVAQGAGAALLSPAALACLNDLVEEPGARRRALGWWTAAAAGGGASGWVLGGLITELAGWRWVFAVNVPIGVIALIMAAVVLPTRGPWSLASDSRFSSRARPPLGRRARAPLVPRALPRRPGVLGGNLTAAALTGSTSPAMLATVLYLQDTLRVSPARGALLFPVFNVAVIAGSLACPRILGRLGARRILVAGFFLVALGIALLVTLPRVGLPAFTLVGAFLAMGTGLGAASVASTSAGTHAVPTGERGAAAGLLNSAAELGAAFGIAVTSPLIAAAAPMLGYRLAFAAAGTIALTGAVAALTVPRTPMPAGPVCSSPWAAWRACAPRHGAAEPSRIDGGPEKLDV